MKLPKAAQRTVDTYAEVWKAYQALGAATEKQARSRQRRDG
jgi:hypothetical protein